MERRAESRQAPRRVERHGAPYNQGDVRDPPRDSKPQQHPRTVQRERGGEGAIVRQQGVGGAKGRQSSPGDVDDPADVGADLRSRSVPR